MTNTWKIGSVKWRKRRHDDRANAVSGPFVESKFLSLLDAIDQGRAVSWTQQTELRIHNLDGKISSSDSYGRDPNPPKG